MSATKRERTKRESFAPLRPLTRTPVVPELPTPEPAFTDEELAFFREGDALADPAADNH